MGKNTFNPKHPHTNERGAKLILLLCKARDMGSKKELSCAPGHLPSCTSNDSAFCVGITIGNRIPYIQRVEQIIK